jgi:hypothetical protein
LSRSCKSFPADAPLISLLRLCAGFRDLCGIDKVSRRFPAYPHQGADPDARQQYINGHFCYAVKGGIVTNGLGICRHIAFFDDDFRKRHPEVSSSRSDCSDKDKEIGDSVSLKPILSDFQAAHPDICFKTFLVESSFDSCEFYSLLKNEFPFDRACIPMNLRSCDFQESDSRFRRAMFTTSSMKALIRIPFL